MKKEINICVIYAMLMGEFHRNLSSTHVLGIVKTLNKCIIKNDVLIFQPLPYCLLDAVKGKLIF